MKKILLSLVLIVLASTTAVSATRAYFSASASVPGNTFSTGTVVIGGSTGLPIAVTNIGPGLSQAKDVTITYTGTLNADLYVGAGGTSLPSDPTYIADLLHLNIYDTTVSGTWFDGMTDYLSTHWVKIGSNLAPSTTESYTVTFSMDPSVTTHMGVTNTDTILKFYAVQTGGSAPATVPYLF